MNVDQEIRELRRRVQELEARQRQRQDLLGGAGAGGVAVKTTAKVSDTKYTVDVYAEGMFDDAGAAKSATDSGKTLFIRQIAAGSTIPNGTFLDADPVDDHYEVNILRWL